MTTRTDLRIIEILTQLDRIEENQKKILEHLELEQPEKINVDTLTEEEIKDAIRRKIRSHEHSYHDVWD